MEEDTSRRFHACASQEVQNTIQSWKRLHWCRSKVTSAQEVTSLMAMFSLIATVELPLPFEEKETNPSLVIAFVATSSMLVAITVLVKVISAFILPHLDSIAEMSVKESVSSPHDQIINWIFYTCILGTCVAPILFCLDLILISWIKFPKYSKDAPLAVTAIITPMIGVILAFAAILHRQMNQFKITKFYSSTFPNRRYSEIAEDWEHGSTSLSSISSSDEKSHLIKSHRSVTSYGAVGHQEFVGSPSFVFADVCWH